MFNYFVNCIEIYIYDKFIVMLWMFLLRRIYLMKIFFLFYFFINERIKKNIKNIGINKYGLW